MPHGTSISEVSLVSRNAGRGVLICALLAAVVLISPLPAPAQGTAGTILGSVMDSSGASVAGATIQVTNIDTGITRSVLTDEAGNYQFPLLLPGRYSISGERAGFRKALVTGESLGQVASQTLDNVATIDEAARMPILRPLIGMDKEEITQQARRIGTFEVSTLPDQDCCQLFVPRSPATAATVREVLAAETALDVPGLVATAVEATRAETFTFPA
jgi:hypothetical protein